MKIENVNKLIKFFDKINGFLKKKEKNEFARWFLSWTPLSTKNENIKIKFGHLGPYSTTERQIIEKASCKSVLNFKSFNEMLNDPEAEIACYIGRDDDKFIEITKAEDLKIVKKYRNKKIKIKTFKDFQKYYDILNLYFNTIVEY
jgi:hypothetical protein